MISENFLKIYLFFALFLAGINAVESEVGAEEPPMGSNVNRIQPESIRVFMQFCITATDCHTLYYYKHTKEEIGKTVEFQQPRDEDEIMNVEATKRVIFFQPPQINYNHMVLLNGQDPRRRQPKETTVYVLPQKQRHTIDIKDSRYTNPDENELDKTTLIFLKTHPDDDKSIIEENSEQNEPEASFSEVQMRYSVSSA